MTPSNAKRYPKRPPRLGGVFPEVAPLFFVTFNSFERKPVLARQEIHDAFLIFCNYSAEYSVIVGRYVIMPDHAHLFVLMPRQGITLGQWIRQLRTRMGKALAELGNTRPFWQEGFFDHLLRNSDSYEEKWAYVRNNPVRAGLVSNMEDWPYQGEIGVIHL